MSEIALKLISKLCELRDNKSIGSDDFDSNIDKIVSILKDDKEEKYYKRAFSSYCDDLYDEVYDIYDSDDELNTDDDILKHYLTKNVKSCVVCRKIVTVEELNKFDQRRLDCACTDWMIGCCCCGSGKRGKDFHKPESVQFACVGDCYKKLKEYRTKDAIPPDPVIWRK